MIQFLVTIVQPSRSGLGSMGSGNNKRRFQLMINDAPPCKVSEGMCLAFVSILILAICSFIQLKKSEGSEGASIQELGEALEAYENEQELL